MDQILPFLVVSIIALVLARAHGGSERVEGPQSLRRGHQAAPEAARGVHSGAAHPRPGERHCRASSNARGGARAAAGRNSRHLIRDEDDRREQRARAASEGRRVLRRLRPPGRRRHVVRSQALHLARRRHRYRPG